MRKIFMFVTVIALTVGLIGFLFNLGEYDFFAQLGKIEALGFANPIEDLRNLINEANKLFSFNSEDVAWYEYIPLFFQWIGTMVQFPIILIKDVALNLYCGLQAVLYILGF